MYIALMQDRVDFVQLFMENGVHLKDFLTIKRMNQLYNNVGFNTSIQFSLVAINMMFQFNFLLFLQIPKNSLLYDLLKKERKVCK